LQKIHLRAKQEMNDALKYTSGNGQS